MASPDEDISAGHQVPDMTGPAYHDGDTDSMMMMMMIRRMMLISWKWVGIPWPVWGVHWGWSCTKIGAWPPIATSRPTPTHAWTANVSLIALVGSETCNVLKIEHVEDCLNILQIFNLTFVSEVVKIHM
jgi:hypothetical protein